MRTFLRRSLELQQRVASVLALPRDTLPRWAFVLALLAIMLLGTWLRAAYFLGHDLDPAYLWKGQLILTSADGFYFATGVGHTLTDAWSQTARVPTPDLHALVALTAGLAKLTGLSVEALFTWLPVVLGPLLAVPVALLGRLFGRSLFGLLAALFAVAGPTYAIRTGLGYFDTDVFTVTVPLLAAVLLARALSPDSPTAIAQPLETLERLRTRAGAVGALVLSVYVFFYDQGVSIAQVIGLATAFALAISPWLSRLRPELGTPLPVAPSATLATATSLANLPVFWPFRALAALVALVALPRLPLAPKVRIALAALVTVGVFMGGETVYKLVRKVEIYTENQSPEAPSPNAAAAPPVRTDSADWKAQDTTGLVAEAKVLPFSAMAKRAASHPIVFVLGLLGVLLLFVTRPALLPLAPLFGVGGFAFFGGHRFLIYLVPFIGLGLAFLGVQGGRLLARLVPTRRAPVAAIGAAALVLAATVPSALQTVAAPPSPAMIVPEIEALEALDRLSKSDDVTIAWWDFGYPIAYFGHTRTITDGSLRGDDAALAAEILLTDSAPLARNLSLLAADALDHSPADGAAVYLFGAAKQAGLGPVDFLGAVRAGRWPIPDPPHDVYLYLPLRIVPIIQALEIYRPTGLHDRRTPPFTRLYRNVKSEGGKLLLGEGLEVDADTVAIWRTNAKGQREKKALHSIHVISRAQPGSSDATPSGATTKRSRPGDPRADTAGVLLRDLRVFIELEPRLLTSVWASLFLFDNADPQSFEPVFENEAAKIYRVRRSAPTTRAPTP